MTREKVEAFGRYEEWEPRKVVEWILNQDAEIKLVD